MPLTQPVLSSWLLPVKAGGVCTQPWHMLLRGRYAHRLGKVTLQGQALL